MATEATILRNIMAYLKSRGDVWAFKVHGSPMQTAGVPDVIGVVQGRFFGLEVKRPGMKATVLQEAVMRKIREQGGVAEVVTSVGDVEAILVTLAPARPAARGETGQPPRRRVGGGDDSGE
jgi:hypothetical protein